MSLIFFLNIEHFNERKEQMIKKKFKKGNSWVVQFELPEEIRITKQEFKQLLKEKPEDLGYMPGPNGAVALPRWQETYLRPYTFSGVEHEAKPLVNEYAKRVHAWVQEHSERGYNQFMTNWYMNGSEYMGKHGDSVRQLVPDSPIYSFSYGAERDFVIEDADPNGLEQRYVLPMPHNTCTIMSYDLQLYYLHGLPVRKRVTKPRVNFTCRHFA